MSQPTITAVSGPGARPAARQSRPTQQQLPLRWHLSDQLPVIPEPPPDVRIRHRPATDPAPGLPEAGVWASHLVQAVIEVLAGARPIGQLARWLSPEVQGQLRRQRTAAVTPRPASATGRGNRGRAVRSVHICSPAAGVVEATVVIGGGQRSRAVALRLEAVGGQWRCTRLAIL